jgi:aryl-alcohol dehydrogenase-like predicted oxidoreductase
LQWSPFAAGRLVRSPSQCAPSIRSTVSTTGDIYNIKGSDCDAVIARVHEIAARRAWPASHVNLAWLNRRVAAPIIGFSSIDRMDEALSARGLRLSQEDEDYLEEAYQAKAVIGHE